jgi:MSHA biogenesis protein MshN
VSLINKMLKDLESRQGETRPSAPRVVYQDLRPARTVGPARRQSSALFAVLLLVALGAGGFYAWTEWGEAWLAGAPSVPVSPAQVAATPAPVEEPPTAETPHPGESPPLALPPAPTAPDLSVAAERETAAVSPKPQAGHPWPAAIGSIPSPSRDVTRAPSPRSEPVADRAAKASAPQSVAASRPAKAPTPRVVAPRVPAQPAADAGKVEKTVKPLTPHEQAEAQYREAAALMRQGRAADAERTLKEALVTEPAHATARELLAGLLLQGGRANEARELLEQGVARNPKHGQFARLLARLYVDGGDEARAIELLERAVEAATAPSLARGPRLDPIGESTPGDADTLAFLATLYQRAARHADAARRFAQALAVRPQEGRWWLGLAISQEAQLDPAASDSYQRAVASPGLDPKLQQYARNRLGAIKK